VRYSTRTILFWLMWPAFSVARAQQPQAPRPEPPHTEEVPAAPGEPEHDPWLDRVDQGLYGLIDRLFGAEADEAAYQVAQVASGSLALALLWDEFHGFQPERDSTSTCPCPSSMSAFMRSSAASIAMSM
jgi:hypothetical protein